MIGVYAECRLKAGVSAQFEAIAAELVVHSRKDKGCVSYGFGAVAGEENTYAFVELWESQADLDLHASQPHFTQAIEQFNALLAADLVIKVVNLK